jgi:glycine/D-amino acid oxidase-like deaminating enzyme
MKPAPRELSCDVLVAGGGIAGVCGALAAARLGVKVILCQDRAVLGGNASSEVRMHIVGATGLAGGVELAAELREGGIVEELRLDLAVHNPQRAPALLDLLLYDKCRREPNLTLLLNTVVDGVELNGRLVRAVTATRASTEDRFRITAASFVDATGDGRLGAEAGVAFRQGRVTEFAERLAVPAADARTLGSTILLQARHHPQPMPFVAPPWVRRFEPKDFRLRPFGRPGFDLGLEYGYWWAEWGGCLDTLKDNERIRDELLAITLGIWNHIKNESGLPVENWALEWIGFVPGKRESRRFVGRHVLSESDLFTSRPFADAIAYGGWPVDLHPPEGVDAPEVPPCDQHHLPHLYDIPLRACLAREFDNLLFAGRNLSATHVAFASTRVMATCGVIGQGVGTAAALACRAQVAPASLPETPALMREVQQRLLRDDCYLVGGVNSDDGDLVRSAMAVTASSAQPGAEAELIRSGQTRAVHGDGRGICAPPDRARPGLHRWMSAPGAGLPAWLEIRWPRPVVLSEIVLVFDTGLHRLLTLSQADGYTAKVLWGRPQPETVRDYRVEALTPTGAVLVADVAGNHQRRGVHRLATPLEATALRVTVSATNGIDHARICEVRAYGSTS